MTQTTIAEGGAVGAVGEGAAETAIETAIERKVC